MKRRSFFPAQVLEPIRKFLTREEKQLKKRKASLEEQDPFNDVSRVTDNASPDTDAAEQFGHARVEAMGKEVNRRLTDIRKALTRIRIGNYGTCAGCGKMIDTDRLMVKPEATLCIKCEIKKEK